MRATLFQPDVQCTRFVTKAMVMVMVRAMVRVRVRIRFRVRVRVWVGSDTFSTSFLRVTFVQYLVSFCSRPKVVSYLVSGENVGQVGMDVPAKFGDSS